VSKQAPSQWLPVLILALQMLFSISSNKITLSKVMNLSASKEYIEYTTIFFVAVLRERRIP